MLGDHYVVNGDRHDGLQVTCSCSLQNLIYSQIMLSYNCYNCNYLYNVMPLDGIYCSYHVYVYRNVSIVVLHVLRLNEPLCVISCLLTT